MKKCAASILLTILIISLCGCGSARQDGKMSVEFYYPWTDLEEALKQDPQCTAIGSETRDIYGNQDNLGYMLTLYLWGPQDAALTSPFPSGTSVLSSTTEEATLTLTMNSVFAQLEGIELTLACTCLAKTCFDLTEAETVHIKAATSENLSAVDVSITRDNYLLTDTITETTPATQ